MQLSLFKPQIACIPNFNVRHNSLDTGLKPYLDHSRILPHAEAWGLCKKYLLSILEKDTYLSK